MLLIHHSAYARAGLIGNPSDGYHGKTLALVVRNFRAEVTLYEWDQVEVVLSQEDRSRFDSVDELVDDVQLHGYYGGVRLVKATIKRFVEYCRQQGHSLHRQNFSVRYQTDIPRLVGLAGSSAIIVATLRCLMEFYGVEIPLPVQPSLALSVETDELGIAAGLQDRVVQTYEGLVYMDFSPAAACQIDGFECGHYEPMDAGLLPPLYVAYNADASRPTEATHGDLRHRYQQGDRAVRRAMERFAELTVAARSAIANRDADELGRLIDENLNLRRSICQLTPGQVQMVETARTAGATAKFCGSGGAIIGAYPDEPTYRRLHQQLTAIGCQVIRPQVLPPG